MDVSKLDLIDKFGQYNINVNFVKSKLDKGFVQKLFAELDYKEIFNIEDCQREFF